MAIFAPWGKKKRMLPFCSKIYGVCAAGGELGGASKPLARWGGVLPWAPWPCQSPWLYSTQPRWAAIVSLARPERNGILIKTNSIVKIKERSLPAAPTLVLLPPPWLRGGAGGHERHSGHISGKQASLAVREWVEALGTPVGEFTRHPWATMLPLTLQSRKSWECRDTG